MYVGIATAGRREQLGRTLEQLARQTRLPDKIVVCPASPEDFDGARAASTKLPLVVVRAPRGVPLVPDRGRLGQQQDDVRTQLFRVNFTPRQVPAGPGTGMSGIGLAAPGG